MIKLVKFIPLIATWIIVLFSIMRTKKRKLYINESEDDKKIDIYNTLMLAITMSLLYVVLALNDKFLFPFLLKHKKITSFFLTWGMHILLLTTVLEIIQFLFDLEEGLIIFFLPFYLVVTGYIINTYIQPFVISNLSLALSVCFTLVLGVVMLIIYRGCIYIRNVV